MSRIYESARKAAARAGLDEADLEAVEGTGSDGADVDAYLRGEQEATPTQHAMILAGVLEGLSNQEIVERVKEIHPGSAIKPGHVSWAIGHERRRGSEWWEEHRHGLMEVRSGLKGLPVSGEG